jgi:protein SCO1/2
MAVLVFGKPHFRGEVIHPSFQAAEIETSDDHGQPFRMSALQGKVVLLYFGYLNCPDECPLTLAHITQALLLLGPRSQEVQMVMVSTDPTRDTPQAMDEFLGKFNPAFLGLTGRPQDMAKIYGDYGVMVLEGGETHSSFTYAIDRSGNIRLTFLPDTPAEDIAHDLRILLSEN